MKLVRFTYSLIPVLISCIASAQTYKMPVGSFTNGSGTVSGDGYKGHGIIGQGVVGTVNPTATSAYTLRPGLIAILSKADPLMPDLVFSSSDVNPSTVKPSTPITVTFTVKNIGFVAVSSGIKVTAYLSSNTDFDPGTDIELEPSFNIGSALEPNASISFPPVGGSNEITIPANTVLKSYQVLLVIDAGNSIEEKSENNNVVSKGITVSSGGGTITDDQGPVFGTITIPGFIANDASITLAVTDEVSGVDRVEFYHRPAISSGDFTKEDVEEGPLYSILMNTSWADEIGIKGYFIAYDKAGNPRTSNQFYVYNSVPSAQAIPNLAFGGQPEDYRIFSIPYDLTDNRIDEIFKTMGPYDKTLWRIVRYQGNRNVDKTEGLTKIERGQGFWFNAINQTEIRVGAGTSVNKDQSPDFSLKLDKGYNQIGDPFTFDISWADVLAMNSSVRDKLSQQILVYNSGNISLDASDDLKAWSGGFVSADEAMTISIPASLKNGSGRTARALIDNSNPDVDAWMISLHIQQGNVINSLGAIGMHPDASLSKDIYDIATPPKFNTFIEFSTEHNEFFQPRFSRDVVRTAVSHNWNFTIESNINSSRAQISWNNEGLQSSKAVLLLYDDVQHTLIDMKEHDRYDLNPQRSKNFRFFFGSDAASVKPDISDLGVAWPNPVTDVVHVPYLVKERSNVQIGIYDLMGRKINDIANGEHAAGYHTATWNRASFDGSIVPAGVYIYRMNGSTTIGRLIVN